MAMATNEKFKPNLIPNNDSNDEVFESIEKSGNAYSDYIVSFKKDGVRMEIIEGQNLGRSLKPSRSVGVNSKFARLVEFCAYHDLVLEGEFYAHGMKFNEIYRFYANTDVTSKEELAKLQNMQKQFLLGYENGDPVYSPVKDFYKYCNGDYIGRLEHEFPDRSIEWLTTFHDDLKFWLFDGFFIGREDEPYYKRMEEIVRILSTHSILLHGLIELPVFYVAENKVGLINLYEMALDNGYEGLVLTHRNHRYKFNRSSHKEATLLKMKDDNNEYDGVVIDVMEGTMIKEGVARKTNELGRSVTSQFKDDREDSGMAKGFLVAYGDETFIVGLKGFDNEAKRELLTNKANYIGRHFKYTGMAPVKGVPRHAFFESWRDSK